jgi:2-desacetyl-2-hydroxyethyl bacteriochlorophyllide A dehydrogenase
VCENCRSGQGNICPTWKLIGLDQEPGAFAEYVAIKAANVFPLLPDVPNEQAVMVEPLANGVHLFNLISRHKFGTLAIYGAGTQGILMLALARMLGYREIAIVDTNAARLAVAKQFGAKLVLDAREGNAADAIVEWTNGRGVDIGIDAVGVTAVRQSLVHATRKGGEIMILGLHDAMSDLDFTLIVRNELRVQGSFAFTAHDFAASKRLIENQDICILPWTVTRPLDEGQAAFDMLTTDPGDTLKVILTP